MSSLIGQTPAEANQLANFPLNFLRTGFYHYDGQASHRTTYGIWWSDTYNDEKYARDLYMDIKLVYPQDRNSRGNGFALRCVARVN